MPDKYDMELESRPDNSDYEGTNLPISDNKEGQCKSCKGWGVQFSTYYKYDEYGEIVEDINEEPCENCDGRAK